MSLNSVTGSRENSAGKLEGHPCTVSKINYKAFKRVLLAGNPAAGTGYV
jgi:hypothetical protein